MSFDLLLLLADRLGVFVFAVSGGIVAVRKDMDLFGAVVLGLFLFSLATGLLGLIVVFPLLGHATWHSYRAIK